MKTNNYVYPVGDFLSGFSDDENNPCDYELECQRMVGRGVEYLDKNPVIFNKIKQGCVKPFDDLMKPMVEFMCFNNENPEQGYGHTGAMVSHTLRHAYHAKKMGWDNYIEKITDKSK